MPPRAMDCQIEAGEHAGWPYCAVGMKRALHSAIGLPSMPTKASLMVGFLMPPDVRSSFMMCLPASMDPRLVGQHTSPRSQTQTKHNRGRRPRLRHHVARSIQAPHRTRTPDEGSTAVVIATCPDGDRHAAKGQRIRRRVALSVPGPTVVG